MQPLTLHSDPESNGAFFGHGIQGIPSYGMQGAFIWSLQVGTSRNVTRYFECK